MFVSRACTGMRKSLDGSRTFPSRLDLLVLTQVRPNLPPYLGSKPPVSEVRVWVAAGTWYKNMGTVLAEVVRGSQSGERNGTFYFSLRDLETNRFLKESGTLP